jgi:hypothetical protein
MFHSSAAVAAMNKLFLRRSVFVKRFTRDMTLIAPRRRVDGAQNDGLHPLTTWRILGVCGPDAPFFAGYVRAGRPLARPAVPRSWAIGDVFDTYGP